MDPDNKEPDFLYLKRKGGLVLLHNGYQFYRNKIYRSGSILWVCSKKKAEKCRGTITIHNSRIAKSKAHSCVSDVYKNEIDKQFYLMKEAARKTLTPIKDVYDEHVIPLKDAGLEFIKGIPTYSSVKSELFNKRKEGLQVTKLSYKSTMEIEVPPAFEPFMLADYACDDVRIIAFCSQEARKLIPTLTFFFGDGTFHRCPRPFQQLYTIHADIGSSTQFINVVPVIYVLMSNQNAKSYEILLNMIKSQIPGFKPQQFMTDYEAAAMSAIRKTFPQVVIKGCFYHYARALWRRKEVIRRDEFISKTNTMLIDFDIEVGFFLERLAWKGSLFKT